VGSENLEMAQETALTRNLEIPMAHETALTRNLEIPIAICITGLVYLALLYSVIWYLE